MEEELFRLVDRIYEHLDRITGILEDHEYRLQYLEERIYGTDRTPL